MLLRLKFYEGQRRSGVLDDGRLVRVLQFKERLPMMHREGWTGPRIKDSAEAFAWFVWDAAHVGPPAITRISCRGRI
jgi:hypothetical protein